MKGYSDDHSGGGKNKLKFGTDGQEKLQGQSPSQGNNAVQGSKGQGHIRSSEGKSGT